MCVSDLSGCNLIGLAGTLAIAISQDLSQNEISVLAAFFTALGDNLALIAAANPSQNDNCIFPDIKN